MDLDNNNENENSTTSLKNPISRLAYTMAKITLRFNLFVNEFIELYKFHMVLLAKKQNPKNSIVELSARTGLDRRYITETLKNEELKKTNSKVRLVLQQMREICKRKNTNLIAKHGNKDSFTSICKQVSSGSLTNNAVAKELLRLEEIVEVDRKYKMADVDGNSINNALIHLYATRRLLNEIHRICVLDNSTKILKHGSKNSIESIFENTDFYNVSKGNIITELIANGNLMDNEECYELTNWQFLCGSNESNLILMSNELYRMTETFVENINNPINGSKKLHRIIYSSQIHPRTFCKLNQHIKKYFDHIKDDLYQLFIPMEEDVPRGTYPTLGISLFSFGPDHNIDYSTYD